MSIKISYTKSNNNSSGNVVLFVDEKFNCKNIKKYISSSEFSYINEIIKFDQLKIDLSEISNTTIKKPKIQETSTLKLTSCFLTSDNCPKNWMEESIPVLNRRVVLPFFIPVTALIACLLFFKKKNIIFNKVSIFLYSFFILLFAETTIRYTGLNNIILNIFVLSPFFLIFTIYLFLKIKLLKE